MTRYLAPVRTLRMAYRWATSVPLRGLSEALSRMDRAPVARWRGRVRVP